MKIKKERIHFTIWYIIFTIMAISLIFVFFQNKKKISEYEELQYMINQTNIQELELTRYYLVNNYCKEKNFTTGFKPLGKVVGNLTIVCMECVEERCGRTETFILK